MYQAGQMGAEVNCSRDHYVNEKGLLRGLSLPCRTRGFLYASNNPVSRVNLEILMLFNATPDFKIMTMIKIHCV